VFAVKVLPLIIWLAPYQITSH